MSNMTVCMFPCFPRNPGHIRNPRLFRAIIPMEESIEIRYQNHFDFNLVNHRNAAKSSSGRAERDSKRQRDDRVKFRGDWVPALGTTNAYSGHRSSASSTREGWQRGRRTSTFGI